MGATSAVRSVIFRLPAAWARRVISGGSDYGVGACASDRLLPSGSRTSTWRTPLP